MDTYHKLFIKISLIFLLIGGTMGMLMGTGLIDPINFKFAHVHINLLGFVINLIYGVAYHILPRFNGKPLKYPDLVKTHVYSGNAGLIGMVTFYTASTYSDAALILPVFYLSAATYLLSMMIFAVNIMDVLIETKEEVTQDNIGAGTIAYDLLKKWPNAASIFKTNGLGIITEFSSSLFRRSWSIEKLCTNSNADQELFITMLKTGVTKIEKKLEETGGMAHAEIVQRNNPVITRGELCSKDVLVGDLLKIYPETSVVFEKHYGESCFSCPGQKFESIEETATMHNASIDMILGEVNEVIEKLI